MSGELPRPWRDVVIARSGYSRVSGQLTTRGLSCLRSWTANIHLIRTDFVDPSWGLQHCIECHGPNQW